jgi:histidinol-phosphate/aromatic aminotransferase/cobyric acid decarboxylase-like protein
MDGTVVTIDEENRIERFVPKNQFKYTETADYYKTVNLYKFSKDFSTSMYVPFLEAYCNSLGTNEYYEQVLRVITMIDKSSIKALPLQGNKWYEIDDAQDLDIAESLFSNHQYSSLCARYGGYWRYPKLLDFCYLVNPYFPNKRMREEIIDNFDVLLTEYPSGLRINNLIAAKDFHIKPDYMVVGNGAAELIKALMEKLEGSIGLIRPTFEEYPNRLSEKNIVTFDAVAPDFAYSADDLISYFRNKNIQSLILINPDNPTGNYIPYADCLRLAKWCGQHNITFILDESFIDFSTEHPTFFVNEILENNPHMIVIKSISKSYGVPGIRLGLLATANKSLMQYIRSNVSIWNINSFGEYFLQIYSKYESAYNKAMDKFRAERERYVDDLRTIPFLRVIPSEANYILCEVKHPYKAEDLAKMLLNNHNILIKDCSNKCNGQYIRLAVRDTKDNTTLVEALRSL